MDAVPRCLSDSQMKQAYGIDDDPAKDAMQTIGMRDLSWCISKQKGWYQTLLSKNWLRRQDDPDYKDCAGASGPDSVIAGCGRLLARGNENWTTVVWAAQVRGMAYQKKGDTERAGSDFAATLSAAKRGTADGQGPIVQEQDAHVWPSDLFSPQVGSSVVNLLGGASFELVLTRQFQRGLDAADLALKVIPTYTLALGNRAHALMFLGRLDEASSIYLGQHGNIQGKTWQQSTLDDFADFRKAGLTSPLMDEVEKAFAANK
jgi:hypothetical protein